MRVQIEQHLPKAGIEVAYDVMERRFLHSLWLAYNRCWFTAFFQSKDGKASPQDIVKALKELVNKVEEYELTQEQEKLKDDDYKT